MFCPFIYSWVLIPFQAVLLVAESGFASMLTKCNSGMLVTIKLQFTMPRLIGKNRAYIDFRHMIDSLVRKPNAFANYRFHEHMFPSIEYRKAFDTLSASLGEASAIRVYLRRLQVAKQEGLASVTGFIAGLQVPVDGISKKSLLASLDAIQTPVPATVVGDVQIEVPALDP